MTDNPNHNADGTFAAGNKANPEGIGGNQPGLTPWRMRVMQLDAKYDTLDKLMRLFEFDANGKASPGADLKKMHPRDCGIICQMLFSVIGDDCRGERESFWDRLEGKPKETVHHEGGVTYGLDQRILDFVREIRRSKSLSGADTTRMVTDSSPKPDSA